MAKKKASKDPMQDLETVDPFVGSEPDDLMSMEYVQDEKSEAVDTHPPETKEEAEMIAEQAEAKAEAKSEEDSDEVEAKDEEVKDDGESEEEAKAEEETKPEVLKDEEHKIPKDRFDEVNERMKRAEDDVRSLKSQLETVIEDKTEDTAPEPYDYDAKEAEAMDALLEGDQTKYQGIRAEIRTAEKDETLREARLIASQGDQQLQETMSFEEIGAQIEADFPQFVENSDSYNSEAREDMLDLYMGYAKSGVYTRGQALQRAADKAVKIYKLAKTGVVAEVVVSDPKKVVDIKTGNPKEKAAAANAQPPVMESRAEGTLEEPRLDVQSMSDEEFDALPEATKARMRGDVM